SVQRTSPSSKASPQYNGRRRSIRSSGFSANSPRLPDPGPRAAPAPEERKRRADQIFQGDSAPVQWHDPPPESGPGQAGEGHFHLLLAMGIFRTGHDTLVGQAPGRGREGIGAGPDADDVAAGNVRA